MAIDDNDISVEHEEPDECIILTESITPSYPTRKLKQSKMDDWAIPRSSTGGLGVTPRRERESLLFSHKILKIPPAQTKWTQIRLYGTRV